MTQDLGTVGRGEGLSRSFPLNDGLPDSRLFFTERTTHTERRTYRNPGDTLVQLFLVKPFDLDPVPDKSLQGRLDRVLRSVGANGTIAVRARMITAISNTKFKTVDGDPVSLVGLHGKDELLVRGPTWAIENLGRGESPDTEECRSWLKQKAKEVAEERARLSLVRTALDFYVENRANLDKFQKRPEFQIDEKSWPRPRPVFQNDRRLNGAQLACLNQEFESLEKLREAVRKSEKRLEWFFDLDASEVARHFLEYDAEDFFVSMDAELSSLAARVEAELRKVEDGERPWWFQWTKAWGTKKDESLVLTESNRHFTRYAVGNATGRDMTRPRGVRVLNENWV